MTVCKTCKHANYCEIVAGGYSSQVKSCRDYRKGEMTNEEWLHTMNAEQLAEFLVMIQMSVMHPVKRGAVDTEKFIEEVVEWLKQPHKGE